MFGSMAMDAVQWLILGLATRYLVREEQCTVRPTHTRARGHTHTHRCFYFFFPFFFGPFAFFALLWSRSATDSECL